MKRSRITLFLVFLFLTYPSLVTCQPSTASVFPGEEWEVVSRNQLADFGWSREGLQAATDFVRDSANSTGIVVVDRGRVVYSFGDIQELSYIASCRKSVLAMLYGDWVDRGIVDLEATLSEMGFDDIGLGPAVTFALVCQLIVDHGLVAAD